MSASLEMLDDYYKRLSHLHEEDGDHKFVELWCVTIVYR